MKFNADKVKVSGPNSDGGYIVTFWLGEYQQQNAVKIMAIPQYTGLEVEVTKMDDHT